MSEPQPEKLLEHYVYVARCANDSLYTGYSKNVFKRIAAHNAGKGAKYTRANRPIELLRVWSFETKTEALQAEYAFKQLSRSQKLALLAKGSVSDWSTVAKKQLYSARQK